jgi:hypothetical protein
MYRYRCIRNYYLLCKFNYFWRAGKIWKRFRKNSISINTDRQIIAGFKTSQQYVHDISHAEKILIPCHRTGKSDLNVLDKGYDSDAMYKLIH